MAETRPRLRDDLLELAVHAAVPNDGRGYGADLNEAPFPPTDSVLAMARRAMSEVNRYPDDRCSELVQALSDELSVPAPHIAVGAGATAIIQQVLLAAVRHGDEVVCSWPSTERYPGLIQVAGARLEGVPLDGAHQDLGALAGAVTERTRVVFVGNPSDLTGTTVHRHALQNFLRRVPPDVLVVIDEEYREFVGEPAAPDGVRLYREHPNVAVIRTFSKAYGLAGLRVGFMVAQPRVIGAVRRTALPFGVSAVAQKAALSALRDQFELRRRIAVLVKERDRLLRLLRAQGWDVPTSGANFLWLPLGTRTDRFVQMCAEHGVKVNGYAGRGARITVGEPEANDLVGFVAARFAAS
ncbi:histidinol-phosphate transaminase [Actinomadura nitritigenes]|uniref:Histidinol-phosphate transaminase n=1 Tax=Actinomadura nitritigenes TaxID=134602 RepID=A0ABS3QUF2_9ACTN|nr:histidinol-phosphate transaminase [Actinomadura nitritigenes]MBO2437610.1 histidinol-phosphate transaminase [Actinomadura nitritigenes]